VFGLQVEGRKNLWPARAFLVSNHSLFLDPALIADAIRPRCAFFSVLERTLEVPVLGLYVRLLGGFPLPAHRPMVRIRTAVSTALSTGRLVHFFPEGRLYHRSTALHGFHDGVFLLAVHEGVPVIPITLVATHRTWRGRVLRRWPRVRAIISNPVQPSLYMARGRSRREAARAMAEDVRGLMKQIMDANTI
jgi:1-acyl-sn-glycerol-3-phosphate acyltransferase